MDEITSKSEDTTSAIIRELERTVELWQQSKYFHDLQAWKDEWYRVNGTDREAS